MQYVFVYEQPANSNVMTYDNSGAVMEVLQVLDQKFYQEFFAKVDKCVFPAKEKL